MRRIGKTAAALALLSALCLSGCSQAQPGAVDTSSPDPVTPSPSPIQSETPTPPDPIDEVYPVDTQEDAAKLLEQAYEVLIPELKYAYALECADGADPQPGGAGGGDCGGFSWAFRLLCEEAGIPCWNVTGTGAGEEFAQDHFWGVGQQELIHALTRQ